MQTYNLSLITIESAILSKRSYNLLERRIATCEELTFATAGQFWNLVNKVAFSLEVDFHLLCSCVVSRYQDEVPPWWYPTPPDKKIAAILVWPKRAKAQCFAEKWKAIMSVVPLSPFLHNFQKDLHFFTPLLPIEQYSFLSAGVNLLFWN